MGSISSRKHGMEVLYFELKELNIWMRFHFHLKELKQLIVFLIFNARHPHHNQLRFPTPYPHPTWAPTPRREGPRREAPKRSFREGFSKWDTKNSGFLE